MSEPKPNADKTTEGNLPARLRWAHILAYTTGSLGAFAIAAWLVERFLNAQYTARSDGRLSAFFSQVTTDLLQVGLPSLLGIMTIAFSGILVTQLSKGVYKRYLGIPEPAQPAFSFSDVPIDYPDSLAARYYFRSISDEVVRNDNDPAQEVVQLRRKLRRYQKENAALEA